MTFNLNLAYTNYLPLLETLMPRKITEIFSNPDNKNKKLKHNEKSSQDLINILDVDFELENTYFYNSFLELARFFPNNPNSNISLKNYLIKKFLNFRWNKMNQQTIKVSKNITEFNLPPNYDLPIYEYTFHIIPEENDGIYSFFYSPNFYNTNQKVFHNLKDLQKAINHLLWLKWKSTLIIQRSKPKPTNNPSYTPLQKNQKIA